MTKFLFVLITGLYEKKPDIDNDQEEFDYGPDGFDPDPGNKIMAEVMAASDEETAEYCRQRGIDVEGLRERLLVMLDKKQKEIEYEEERKKEKIKKP